MIPVVDEVLAGVPRYRITHSDSTTEDVSIDLITEVTTEGTPLNKALFDSIDDDIQARVLISSKATTSEAQALSNDNHYMTPSKTKDALKYMTKTGSESNSTSTAQSYTILNLSDVPSDAKRVTITGKIRAVGTATYNSGLQINGSGISFQGIQNTSNGLEYGEGRDASSLAYSMIGTYGVINNSYHAFQIDVDLSSKSFTYSIGCNNGGVRGYNSGTASYTSLISIIGTIRTGVSSTPATLDYTTTYTY